MDDPALPTRPPGNTSFKFAHRWVLAAAASVFVIFGVLSLTSQGSKPVECSAESWGAFMLPLADDRQDRHDREGWILWCDESHWTLNITGDVAGESTSRQARGEPTEIFPWFSPNLSADEAWKQLAGTENRREVTPRHSAAVLAFTIKTDLGRFRLEFSSEGIPVLALVPGEDGFRFWASRLDRADRTVWSDEDVMNWPACDRPGQGGFLNQPQPCWIDSGSARPDGRCFENLAQLTFTGEFKTLGCSL